MKRVLKGATKTGPVHVGASLVAALILHHDMRQGDHKGRPHSYYQNRDPVLGYPFIPVITTPRTK
jgi:hypothetical protein